jgi:hypothetical protein
LSTAGLTLFCTMKRLGPALLVVAVAAASALFVATPATAQRRDNGRIKIGDATTPVRVNGNLEVNAPLHPLDTTNGLYIDAGSATTVGLSVNGQVQMFGPLKCGADVACGTVALVSGSPSTVTKTVASGSTCFCWPVGTTAAIAAGGCAANVSATTATFTGPNTVTTTVGYVCFK